MDTVERALQKARKNSTSRLGGAYSSRKQHREAAVAARARLAPGADNSKNLLDFVYKSTRVQLVPSEVLRRNRLLAGFHGEAVSDTYRMLRVQILQQLKSQGGSSLAVCSANAGEGKTLTSANLAISLSLDPNRTVLLVDLDLRRPRLHHYFQIEVKQGICDYLEGSAELADCLVNPGISHFVLLPVRRPVLNSSELLSSSRITNLIEELGKRYPDRIVIYDLPPLLASDDSLVILPQVDSSLLVVQEGKTGAGAIQKARRLLQDHHLIGTVLNRSAQGNIHPYY